MFDIIAHRLFIGSVQCLCASWLYILCLYSVFFHLIFFLFLMHTSCVFSLCIHACTPMWYIIPHHTFGGLYIWRAIYIWRSISISRTISVWRAPRSSKDWITLTLGYQVRQKWRNWSLEIRTMYQAPYTLHVYIHHVYTLDIPSIWSGGQRQRRTHLRDYLLTLAVNSRSSTNGPVRSHK